VETTGGQEFHIPGDEAVDIFIDGEEVEDEDTAEFSQSWSEYEDRHVEDDDSAD